MGKIKRLWRLTLAAALVVGVIVFHLVTHIDVTAAETECRVACVCIRQSTSYASPRATHAEPLVKEIAMESPSR
jgi:hypothetical protein